jgi:hypothetical protein
MSRQKIFVWILIWILRVTISKSELWKSTYMLEAVPYFSLKQALSSALSSVFVVLIKCWLFRTIWFFEQYLKLASIKISLISNEWMKWL